MSNKTRFKISIAMATYNGAPHLYEQLDSFLTQTRLPDELIVCDDGSTDETISIIEEFSSAAPFLVKLIKNDINLGYVKNFEKVISLCTGDLIFISDQDDVWFSDKIQYIEKVFQKGDGALLVIHDGQLVDERLNGKGVSVLGQVRAGFGSDEHLITGAISVIHKDLTRYILPFPQELAEFTSIGHDGWIHLVAKFMGTRQVIDKSLQVIRRHSLNTSAWVASSTDQISKLTVLKSHFRTSPATSYQDRIYLNEAMQERLEHIRNDKLNQVYFSRIDVSLSYFRSERQAIVNRGAILNAKFFARKWKAFLMLIRGEYKYFNGFSSFMRDVVR